MARPQTALAINVLAPLRGTLTPYAPSLLLLLRFISHSTSHMITYEIFRPLFRPGAGPELSVRSHGVRGPIDKQLPFLLGFRIRIWMDLYVNWYVHFPCNRSRSLWQSGIKGRINIVPVNFLRFSIFVSNVQWIDRVKLYPSARYCYRCQEYSNISSFSVPIRACKQEVFKGG
jgi:hypothetical protein